LAEQRLSSSSPNQKKKRERKIIQETQKENEEYDQQIRSSFCFTTAHLCKWLRFQPDDRVKVLTKFLLIAEQLCKMNNFNTLFAILAAQFPACPQGQSSHSDAQQHTTVALSEQVLREEGSSLQSDLRNIQSVCPEGHLTVLLPHS
jgi:hypothetical protein